MLLNKFVFQCTFFLLFQTLLPTPTRVLEPACAGSTERQFSKNSHEHTSTTSSKQNFTWSYQLNAQLAMVGKKPQGTRSDLDLPDPSGLDLPRTLRWAYLALVSEEKWVLLSSGKAAAAFPWGLLCTLEQGTRVSELVSRTRPLRLLWKTYPNLARRLTSIKKIHPYMIHGDFWLQVRVWAASNKNEAWDHVLEKKKKKKILNSC